MQPSDEKRQTTSICHAVPSVESGSCVASSSSEDSATIPIALGLERLRHRDLAGAEAAFRIAIQHNPLSAAACNNLGVCLMQAGRLADAADAFGRAISLQPDHAEAINNLAVIQLETGQLQPAINNLRLALQIRPEYAEAWNNLGNALAQSDEPAMAADCYRRSLAIAPGQADPLTNLGTVLMELGEQKEADQAFRLAIRSAPDQPVPLATALTWLDYRDDDADFSRLSALYAQRAAFSPAHQALLGFAMGRILDKVGQHERAFEAWEEANRVQMALRPFDEQREERIFSQMQTTFNAALIQQIAQSRTTLPTSIRQRTPVFIVGMMRSGSTLLEQMLAAHPKISVAGEVPWLQEAVEQLQKAPPDADSSLLDRTGIDYLDKLWYRHPAASQVVDKQLGNYLHLGLIHLLFPHAPILHIHRNPLDCCFSCYTLRFSRGHEYTFNLQTMGRQYRRYHELMQHWRTVLPPGRILDIRYESLVTDPESVMQQVVAHLGVAWHPACLQPESVRRTVRTASLVQARQPVYRTAIGRWRPYAAWLGPLIDSLGELTADHIQSP